MRLGACALDIFENAFRSEKWRKVSSYKILLQFVGVIEKKKNQFSYLKSEFRKKILYTFQFMNREKIFSPPLT